MDVHVMSQSSAKTDARADGLLADVAAHLLWQLHQVDAPICEVDL